TVPSDLTRRRELGALHRQTFAPFSVVGPSRSIVMYSFASVAFGTAGHAFVSSPGFIGMHDQENCTQHEKTISRKSI
ncbi:hypothetical protein PFISCL1PPCAC_28062, partial [Pristionchus fissidentatus]